MVRTMLYDIELPSNLPHVEVKIVFNYYDGALIDM